MPLDHAWCTPSERTAENGAISVLFDERQPKASSPSFLHQCDGDLSFKWHILARPRPPRAICHAEE